MGWDYDIGNKHKQDTVKSFYPSTNSTSLKKKKRSVIKPQILPLLCIYYLFWAVHNVAQYAFSFSYHSDQIWSTQRHTCNEEVTFSNLSPPGCLRRFTLTHLKTQVLLPSPPPCSSRSSDLGKRKFKFSRYLEQKLWKSSLIPLSHPISTLISKSRQSPLERHPKSNLPH